MIIIGERINASRPAVKKALDAKDETFIKNEAKAQGAAGAHFIDVNCGLSHEREAADMAWLAKTVQDAVGLPLCIDSPDPVVIEKGVSLSRERPLVNSITLEEERFNRIIPIILEYRCMVIALTMSAKGMPETADDRFEIAEALYEKLKYKGVPDEDIYFDPLVRPVSSEPKQAGELLRSIPKIKKLGNVKVSCGISNVSYGLPRRTILNSVFLSMALEAGMDAALIDPLDKRMQTAIKASEALLGKDRYCMNFIQAHRKSVLI